MEDCFCNIYVSKVDLYGNRLKNREIIYKLFHKKTKFSYINQKRFQNQSFFQKTIIEKNYEVE